MTAIDRKRPLALCNTGRSPVRECFGESLPTYPRINLQTRGRIQIKNGTDIADIGHATSLYPHPELDRLMRRIIQS